MTHPEAVPDRSHSHPEPRPTGEAEASLGVMQAILTLERAGAQQVVRMLAQHLQENGCRVTVCAFEDGPVRSDIEKLGIPVEIVSRPRYSVVLLPMFLAEMLRIRRELARLIDSHHVDVLQTHMLQVLDFMALSLRYTTRLRVVLWTIHNVEFLPERTRGESQWLQELKRRGYLLLYRLMSRHVDGFIAVSEAVRRSIVKQAGVAPDKVFTIRNAVDLTLPQSSGDKRALCDQLGIDPQSRLVVTIGRLTEQKGYSHLLEASRSVVSLFSDAHFLIIGDGKLGDRLKRQAECLGLEENIHFLGIRQDVPELLAAADLFVLPSLWEGLSIALLEAMAAGKPIVVTAVPGTAEVMIPGETGLVVLPGNEEALADAIVQLLEDSAQAQAMGQAARKHVDASFSAQKHADMHLELYRLALQTKEG